MTKGLAIERCLHPTWTRPQRPTTCLEERRRLSIAAKGPQEVETSHGTFRPQKRSDRLRRNNRHRRCDQCNGVDLETFVGRQHAFLHRRLRHGLTQILVRRCRFSAQKNTDEETSDVRISLGKVEVAPNSLRTRLRAEECSHSQLSDSRVDVDEVLDSVKQAVAELLAP